MVFYLVVNPVQNDEKKELAIPFAHLKGKTLNILNIVFIDFVFITCKFVYNCEEKNVKEEFKTEQAPHYYGSRHFGFGRTLSQVPALLI